MDFTGLPAYFAQLGNAAGDTAVPAVNAMASAFKFQVQNVALKQVAHAPGIYWEAAPMRPPAYASGFLAASMIMRPAIGGGNKATAMVGNTAKYAAIQEEGGPTWPNHRKYMHWVNTGGPWWKKRVEIPPHPYFRPTIDRMVRNGDLTRAAYQAFWVRVLPYFNG